jgi:hypothetical protein
MRGKIRYRSAEAQFLLVRWTPFARTVIAQRTPPPLRQASSQRGSAEKSCGNAGVSRVVMVRAGLRRDVGRVEGAGLGQAPGCIRGVHGSSPCLRPASSSISLSIGGPPGAARSSSPPRPPRRGSSAQRGWRGRPLPPPPRPHWYAATRPADEGREKRERRIISPRSCRSTGYPRESPPVHPRGGCTPQPIQWSAPT